MAGLVAAVPRRLGWLCWGLAPSAGESRSGGCGPWAALRPHMSLEVAPSVLPAGGSWPLGHGPPGARPGPVAATALAEGCDRGTGLALFSLTPGALWQRRRCSRREPVTRTEDLVRGISFARVWRRLWIICYGLSQSCKSACCLCLGSEAAVRCRLLCLTSLCASHVVAQDNAPRDPCCSAFRLF